MSTISTGRVIVGGLVAGFVLNCIDYAVNGMWLAPQWTAATAKLGNQLDAMSGTAVGGYVAADFVCGLVIVWLYAAIRPRFGPGAGTAVKAAIAVWLVNAALSMTFVMIGMYPGQLMTTSLACTLVGMLIAAYVGGMIYKEE
jgi:hypothetical protein